MRSELRKQEKEISEKHKALALLNPKCPKCRSRAGLFIAEGFREFLAIVLKQVVDSVPDGVAFTYKCPWCRRVRTFTIADLLDDAFENLTGTAE